MADRSVIPPPEAFREIAAHFRLQGDLVAAAAHGSGHINDTYAVTFDQAGSPVRYIFQRINDRIFRDVPALMDNIGRVTAHLAGRTRGGEDNRRAMTLVPARDARPFHRTPDGEYWRVYLFIEKARTYDQLESAGQAFQAARAFGRFQMALADLPGPRLVETIPGFHDTRSRFDALRRAAADDTRGRAREVEAELEFAWRREADVDRLLDLMRSGAMPERVTHNDTKINNVMLDDATGEGVCVIDLDTVMPGLSLYDFGDMVRTATCAAPEDEKDLSRVAVRMPVFEALTRGFAEGVGGILTDAEWEHLPFAGKLLTFEVGMRFLTDHLQGDVYFKTQRTGHNLDRCRMQFRLVECLEEREPEMRDMVGELRPPVAQFA